jgi:hypothetical protein
MATLSEGTVPARPLGPAPSAADFNEAVNSASVAHRLDPDLVNIVIHAESGSAAARPISPEKTAQHLRELLERYNFDLVKALAAYVAGPERVEQCNCVPPDARAYVARIVHEYNAKIASRRKTQRNRDDGGFPAKGTLEVEQPLTQGLPPGVFNIDPMHGHGQIKLFMGTGCSWNNVDAESKKKATETGTLANHTFMISPSDETCYVWDRDVDQFLAKGAIRGEPIIHGQRIVAYKKPDTSGTTVDKPNAQLVSPQPLPNQARTVPVETRASSSAQPDLSVLTFGERQSVEAACSHAKYSEGPAAYDRCLTQQLAAWTAGPRQPDLSRLTFGERQSIEAACSHAKYSEGPAAYDGCLIQQLAAWTAGPRQPDLSRLTFGERQSIEAACSHAKYSEGPAAYDGCLIRQLEALGNYQR